jgi:hypothetical protein
LRTVRSESAGVQQGREIESDLQREALRGLLRQQASIIQRLQGELRAVRSGSAVTVREIRGDLENAVAELKLGRLQLSELRQHYELVWVHRRLVSWGRRIPNPIRQLLKRFIFPP